MGEDNTVLWWPTFATVKFRKLKISENKIETNIFMAYRWHRPESLAVVLKQILPLAFEMNRGLKTKN